jgi:ubiquinone/menaquinone biosynthesis C-methylase UbiE
MRIDERVIRRYEVSDEDARLWVRGRGDLIRLRTWDIFDRYLPPEGSVLDVGGGPGTHSAHLAECGFHVTLLDPLPHHVESARRRASGGGEGTFDAVLGEARELPSSDESLDAVLLMGPLYHLTSPDDRSAALREARRVLRPGGVILAEVISRFAWILDATLKGLLERPEVWADFTRNVETGLSQDPDADDEGFWAYFHRPDELRTELSEAGFDDIQLLGVEGFGWLLGDLERQMDSPDPLLRALRLVEGEPSMLGCSAHVLGVAIRP